MPSVNGQLLKMPTLNVAVDDEGVIILIDDQANPEFWARIKFTIEELTTLHEMWHKENPAVWTSASVPSPTLDMLGSLVEQTPCPECGKPDLLSVTDKEHGGHLECRNCHVMFSRGDD